MFGKNARNLIFGVKMATPQCLKTEDLRVLVFCKLVGFEE